MVWGRPLLWGCVVLGGGGGGGGGMGGQTSTGKIVWNGVSPARLILREHALVSRLSTAGLCYYLYGRSRQTSIDDNNGFLDAVGRHAVGSVTIGQVVRTVVARLAHCVVPFYFEAVLARFGRFARETFSLARMGLSVFLHGRRRMQNAIK